MITLFCTISSELMRRDEPDDNPCQQKAQKCTEAYFLYKCNDRRGMSGFFGGVCSEEKHEADDACTIVQQGFCIDKCGEAFAGFQFVQQGYDGYRVGGTDQGSEHQCKCPCPRFKTGDEGRYSHYEGAGQQHADDKSGADNRVALANVFLKMCRLSS